MKPSPELRAIAPKPKKAKKPKTPPPPRIIGDVAFPVIRRIEGMQLGRGKNNREPWFATAGRVKREKGETWKALGLYPAAPPFPLVVTMTRVSSGDLDTDNNAGALCNVRDAIAHWLGVDDGIAERDGRVLWVTNQRKVARGVWHVEIDIRPAGVPKRSPLEVLSAWQAKGCPMVRHESPTEVF